MKLKLSTLRSLVLYNYRYIFAYFIIFLFSIYFFTWRLGSIAPGISQSELVTAARNITLTDFIAQPIYPLHSVLQWLSMHLFGVSAISLRLPSIIIAAVTVLLLYSLLKKWFGKVTALLTTALLLSADWFLFIARLGTGSIEFSLWFCLMIFSLMKLIEKKTNWLLAYALGASMLLFIPYGIYAVVTVTIGVGLCGMFKKRIIEAPNAVKVGSASLLLVATSLVIFFSVKDIAFLKTLFGLVGTLSMWDYFKNLVINSSGIVMIWPDNNPLLGPSDIFLIRFFEFVFMLFGLMMLWVTRVNRLNIIVISSAVVLAVASGLSSGSRGGSLLLVPAAIFMTAGLRHFIHRWQRTFPKNPYAKVVLYVPVAIMIATTAVLHYQSYFVLWPNQTATRTVFTPDLKLLQQELTKEGDCVIIGAPQEIVTLVESAKHTCQISFVLKSDPIELSSGQRIISYGNKPLVNSGIHTSLNSSTRENNVRWIVTTL